MMSSSSFCWTSVLKTTCAIIVAGLQEWHCDNGADLLFLVDSFPACCRDEGGRYQTVETIYPCRLACYEWCGECRFLKPGMRTLTASCLLVHGVAASLILGFQIVLDSRHHSRCTRMCLRVEVRSTPLFISIDRFSAVCKVAGTRDVSVRPRDNTFSSPRPRNICGDFGTRTCLIVNKSCMLHVAEHILASKSWCESTQPGREPQELLTATSIGSFARTL